MGAAAALRASGFKSRQSPGRAAPWDTWRRGSQQRSRDGSSWYRRARRLMDTLPAGQGPSVPPRRDGVSRSSSTSRRPMLKSPDHRNAWRHLGCRQDWAPLQLGRTESRPSRKCRCAERHSCPQTPWAPFQRLRCLNQDVFVLEAGSYMCECLYTGQRPATLGPLVANGLLLCKVSDC